MLMKPILCKIAIGFRDRLFLKNRRAKDDPDGLFFSYLEGMMT